MLINIFLAFPFEMNKEEFERAKNKPSVSRETVILQQIIFSINNLNSINTIPKKVNRFSEIIFFIFYLDLYINQFLSIIIN